MPAVTVPSSPSGEPNAITGSPIEIVDGVKFKNVFNAGKQQASPIMNLSFPEGVSFEAVFRPTHRQFAEFYENYDVVKKYFPHLFAKIDTTKINSPSTVLVLERINGYDSKFKNDEFQKHIANPKNFEDLCQNIFQMVDEIYQKPLSLTDINPIEGGNVIYNTDTKKFQFFDGRLNSKLFINFYFPYIFVV